MEDNFQFLRVHFNIINPIFDIFYDNVILSDLTSNANELFEFGYFRELKLNLAPTYEESFVALPGCH